MHKRDYFDNIHVIRETVPLNLGLIVPSAFIRNISSDKIKYLSTNRIINIFVRIPFVFGIHVLSRVYTKRL